MRGDKNRQKRGRQIQTILVNNDDETEIRQGGSYPSQLSRLPGSSRKDSRLSSRTGCKGEGSKECGASEILVRTTWGQVMFFPFLKCDRNFSGFPSWAGDQIRKEGGMRNERVPGRRRVRGIRSFRNNGDNGRRPLHDEQDRHGAAGGGCVLGLHRESQSDVQQA